MINYYIFIVFPLFTSSEAQLIKIDDNNNLTAYGPFVISSLEQTPCRGPKPINATRISERLFRRNNSTYFQGNITYLYDTYVSEFRVTFYRRQGNRNIVVWNYSTKGLCQKIFFKEILNRIFKANNTGGCLVKRGIYFFEADLAYFTDMLFGGIFYYGKYNTKIVVLGKKGNIYCGIQHLTLSRKN